MSKPKQAALALPETVAVKLAIARAGLNGGMRGDIVNVGLAEARRMYAAGQVADPAGDLLKLFADMDAAEVSETAEAAADPVAEKADAVADPAAETAKG